MASMRERYGNPTSTQNSKVWRAARAPRRSTCTSSSEYSRDHEGFSSFSGKLGLLRTRGRPAIIPDIVSKYFDNLELELEGIDPAAIVNYDETNLQHDPGTIKAIARRGVRHVETIVDSSKQSTSVMVSVTGNGQ
ncbi:28S ribosomal protein S10, mitochondrial [Frankliniella fusca]|uniref:28S ribosomal protein S10, mitochondrial n=1 Tax=Frankliniella fusca TaxID=407009 RepID=A0AAE1I1Y6_9NEOP|nr:28S ribosomal protein S10, mitochondrial [Frankliniella fusca]